MTLLSYSRFPPQQISTIIEATHCKADASSPLKNQVPSWVFFALLCTTHRTKTEGFNSTWFRKLSTTTSRLIKPSPYYICKEKMAGKKSANHEFPKNWVNFSFIRKFFTKKRRQPTIWPNYNISPTIWGKSVVFSVAINPWTGHPKGHSDRSFLHRSHRLRPSPPWVAEVARQAAVFSGKNP